MLLCFVYEVKYAIFNHVSDDVLNLLKEQICKINDDSLLITSMLGQIQIQGERLRQVEVVAMEVKDAVCGRQSTLASPNNDAFRGVCGSTISQTDSQIEQRSPSESNAFQSGRSKMETVDNIATSPGKALEPIECNSEVVKTDVREGMENLNNCVKQHHADLAEQLEKLQDTASSQLGHVAALLGDIKGKLSTQTVEMTKLQSANNLISNKMKRLTHLSMFMNMKQKQEISALKNSSGQLKSSIVGKLNKQTRTTKIQNEELEEMMASSLTVNAMLKDDLYIRLDKLETRVERQTAELSAQGRSIIDQIVAECRFLREIKRKNRTPQTVYTCDFHVINFSQWVGSGEKQYSRVWFIEQPNIHIKGDVKFEDSDRSINVGLVHGCYPKTVGLRARGQGRINVKVTAVRTSGDGDDWELGSKVWNIEQEGITSQSDGWVRAWGLGLATVSCDEMIANGLVTWDKLVLRYDVTVL